MSNATAIKIERFVFPKATSFGRIVAKDKILKNSSGTASVKKLFRSQIERVRCSHELTEEKLNLKSSQAVPKILIIQIFLKSPTIDKNVLGIIDRAFGVPVFFDLHFDGQYAYAACYRRRNETDKSKWVFSDYFISVWLKADSPEMTMPIALSLETLYQDLIRKLLPASSNEPLINLVERIETTHKLERQMNKVQARLQKEKQFNRRVKINVELKQLQQEIAGLTS